jgi:hypothetical protein
MDLKLKILVYRLVHFVSWIKKKLNVIKIVMIVKNYLIFLLNLVRQTNLKISRLDSLPNTGLKLNCIRVVSM